MNIYPLIIVKDRYDGLYSDGKFTAWNADTIPSGIISDDAECAWFWHNFDNHKLKNDFGENVKVGFGNSPNEAMNDLLKKLKRWFK